MSSASDSLDSDSDSSGPDNALVLQYLNDFEPHRYPTGAALQPDRRERRWRNSFTERTRRTWLSDPSSATYSADGSRVSSFTTSASQSSRWWEHGEQGPRHERGQQRFYRPVSRLADPERRSPPPPRLPLQHVVLPHFRQEGVALPRPSAVLSLLPPGFFEETMPQPTDHSRSNGLVAFGGPVGEREGMPVNMTAEQPRDSAVEMLHDPTEDTIANSMVLAEDLVPRTDDGNGPQEREAGAGCGSEALRIEQSRHELREQVSPFPSPIHGLAGPTMIPRKSTESLASAVASVSVSQRWSVKLVSRALRRFGMKGIREN